MTPRSRGGTDDPSNIAQACAKCNRMKGAKVGRWLYCGHASWRADGHCLDMSCWCRVPGRESIDWLMTVEIPRNRRECEEADRRRREADAELCALVLSYNEEGISLREMAAELGVSHQAVSKMCARARKSRQAP